MARFLNSGFRYLIMIIPALIVLLFGIAYQQMYDKIEMSLINEKFIEKQQKIDMIAEHTETHIEIGDNWYTYPYEETLSEEISYMDSQPYTFASLYDSELNIVSGRTPSYKDPYEPLDNPDFREEVLNNEFGEYISPYKPIDAPERDMYIYYRWVPTDTTLENRYLVIMAISKYSVQNTLPATVWTIPMILCTIVTILSTASVWLLRYLGVIYFSRSGDMKWRAEKDES